MTRRLLNLLTALSLVLCVAAVVLWVRSYAAAEHWIWFGQDREVDVYSTCGRLVLAAYPKRSGSNLVGWWHDTVRPPAEWWRWTFVRRKGMWGFNYETHDGGSLAVVGPAVATTSPPPPSG